ncbi:MAG: hypothetical protein ACRDRN_07275 [Sciscionella sp.]
MLHSYSPVGTVGVTERRLDFALFGSERSAEGVRSFVERRPARFTGR